VGHLILYASVIVVAALAMRPKLSLAIVATVPVSLAIYQSVVEAGLPDWALISGIVTSAYGLAAAIVALLFRRAGDLSSWGENPSGREARYSRADVAGLWYTFALLCAGALACVLAVLEPPYGSVVMRAIALVVAPLFATFAVTFWRLLRDSHIVVAAREEGLAIDGTLHPWSDLEGHTFSFGIFRVYDKAGRMVLRVDNTIDGFPALLYHVNRKTMAR